MNKLQANVILNNFKDMYNDQKNELRYNAFLIGNLKRDFANKFKEVKYLDSKIKNRALNRGITIASATITIVLTALAFIGLPIIFPIMFGGYTLFNLALEIKRSRTETMDELLKKLNDSQVSTHEYFAKIKQLSKRNDYLVKNIKILDKKIDICQKYILDNNLKQDFDYSVMIKESKEAEEEIKKDWDDVYTFSL